MRRQQDPLEVIEADARTTALANRPGGGVSSSLSKALTSMLESSTYADALFLEKERAQVTLNSIGDAVISTDVAGNITYLNPVAESMTGWSPQEACGQPLQNVLRMIDGDSREPAMNPLAMAILHNQAVGLSANCVLIRRDGYELRSR